MTVSDGRQIAPTLDGIRDDHVNRYRFAADQLACKTVIDAAAGIGYGSGILADVCPHVYGFEIDPQAVAYQRWHYRRPNVTTTVANVTAVDYPEVDAAVSFETIEHLRKPEKMLTALAKACPLLIGSVPNQDVTPFDPARHKYHVRHYTAPELTALLRKCGWHTLGLWFQQGKTGHKAAITRGPVGMTIVFMASRAP